MKKTFIILALLSFSSVRAQIWARHHNKFADLKTKGVYVVMVDTTSEVNNIFWHIYKKHWTYSPVNFLSYENMDKYIQPGNYFFTIIRNNIKTNQRLVGLWDINYSYSLQLWEHEEKNRPGLKEELLNGTVGFNDMGGKHITSLFGEYLFSTEEKSFYMSDNRTNGKPEIPKLDFYTDCNYAGIDKNGKNLFFNWSEGLLKNYLQGLSWYAEQHKTIATEIYEKEQMELLKKDTLFVPDFAFTEYKLSKSSDVPVLVDKNNTKESISTDNQNVKNIFRRYKHPYKVISSQELSNKLLYDKKPFFYFLYTVSYTGKLITIVNSLNGENIYATSSTKGEYNGIKEVFADRVTEIKLQVEDIDKLVEKMQIK